jgi:SAM-dependent methyltransferase
MKKSVNFDEFTDNYNQLLNNSTKFFSSSEQYFAQYKVDEVRRSLTSLPSSILEYGCGIGRNIHYLKTAYPDAILEGSDISEASLELARKLNPSINFFNEENGFDKAKTYDLIFIAGVFHHIPPLLRDSVISNLKERLSSTGSLFIFEHNPFNPITRNIVDKCPYDEDAILLKPSEMKSRLSNAKFEIVETKFCLFIPPKLKSLIFLERYLSWLPLGGQYWVHARQSS